MILEGSVRLPFRYAAGRTASASLEALRDEERILASRCSGCGRVACPARSLCPACDGQADELVEVGPEGTLLSWTDVPGRGAYGLVRLDGADTAMLHCLGGPLTGLRAGARVRATFAEERSASILGLAGFEVLP